MSGEIVALFTDGGLVGPNPSKFAGTYAWCAVDRDGEHVREAACYLEPNDKGYFDIMSKEITNNDAEFYAALRALEGMKDGWSGVLASDSEVTIGRLKKIRDNWPNGELPRGFRMAWMSRAGSAFQRLGEVKLVLLAGHPNKAQLEAGHKEQPDGTRVRVSRHNVWCDEKCTELAKTYQQRIVGFDKYVQFGLDQPAEEPVTDPVA